MWPPRFFITCENYKSEYKSIRMPYSKNKPNRRYRDLRRDLILHTYSRSQLMFCSQNLCIGSAEAQHKRKTHAEIR